MLKGLYHRRMWRLEVRVSMMPDFHRENYTQLALRSDLEERIGRQITWATSPVDRILGWDFDNEADLSLAIEAISDHPDVTAFDTTPYYLDGPLKIAIERIGDAILGTATAAGFITLIGMAAVLIYFSR